MYILSGMHKATNVISKKTNHKGQKVTKPQAVFLYNRYMSVVDLTDRLLTVPSAWLINTLLSPYQAKKGVGESTQAMLVLYVMSAKNHCQMLVLGTVKNPKSTPLTGVQYVSMHCVLILVLGYITLKRTTQVK